MKFLLGQINPEAVLESSRVKKVCNTSVDKAENSTHKERTRQQLKHQIPFSDKEIGSNLWRELSDKPNIDKGTNMALICLPLISSRLLDQPVRFLKSDQPTARCSHI